MSSDTPGRSKTCPQCRKAYTAADLPFPSNFNRQRYCGLKCQWAAKKHSPEQAQASFWSRVDKSGDCWLWTGYKQPDGYGQFRVWGKFYNSHKYAYELANGPVPAGMEVMHSCHVRHCVNAKHMRIGTHLENIRESVAIGRHAHGERSRVNKLTEIQVREIKRDYRRDGHAKSNSRELAERYGVDRGAIAAIVRGDAWSHVK